MIRLTEVCKTYVLNGVRKTVANRISAEFSTGSSVGLVGRNGAGKSSLLRMIAGTTPLDSGEITSEGTISWPVGFAGSFHNDMTGAQNTRFIARVYGVDTDELLDYVAYFAELGKHFDLPVRSYSSGMRSRLAFGISMGIRFDTYLVDEVTSVGDASFRDKSQKVFLDRMQSASAVVVSHNPTTLLELCDQIAVLENGQLQLFKNVAEGLEFHREITMRAAPLEA